MKHLAHIWAQQNSPDKKCGSIFFEGDTIYSFGHHYPLAKFFGTDTVLINVSKENLGGSSFTSRHRQAVRAATRHLTCFDVEGIPKTEEEGVQGYRDKMEEILSVCDKPRVREITKARAIQIAYEVHSEMVKFIMHFGLSNDLIATFPADDQWARTFLTLHDQGEAARREDRRLRESIKEQEKLGRWLKGEDVGSLWNTPPHLRVKKYILSNKVDGDAVLSTVVQTSLGAQVPYEDARRMFGLIQTFWIAGRTFRASEQSQAEMVRHFTLSTITNTQVQIGCHTFDRSEVERFAKQEGWL